MAKIFLVRRKKVNYMLNQSQLLAIDHFRQYAKNHKSQVESSIHQILKMSNISTEAFQKALSKLKKYSHVALHFHPDRLDSNMLTVAESLFKSGVYKSQFETKISNGSVSAFSGGDRDLWERKLYNGAYHVKDFNEKERPKYGALNLLKHPHGPAPRFGSCYFLLNPDISKRCTYTFQDSHTLPTQIGTIDEFDLVMDALLSEVFSRDFALGEYGMTVSKLMKFLLEEIEKPFEILKSEKRTRNLNHYIEVQVHGEILLLRDVNILVADPSFKNTEIGNHFQKISDNYNVKLDWHSGYSLDLEDIPLDFRGPTMPSLAKRVISFGNTLTTKMIGDAAQSLKRNPGEWSDRGSYNEVLQELKLLWHVLVTFG
jgi:hypothetical protein